MANQKGLNRDFGFDPERKAVWFEANDFMRYLIKVFAVFVFLFFIISRHATVDGESMHPTFENMDRVLLTDLFYTPHDGDVVAFYENKTFNKPLIKRVIGQPGDVIKLSPETGLVYRNGQPLDEPYTAAKMMPNMTGDLSYPLTVPKGYIFVMGDNRNNSHDSRFSDVGLVPDSEIIGHVFMRFFPFSKVAVFK